MVLLLVVHINRLAVVHVVALLRTVLWNRRRCRYPVRMLQRHYLCLWTDQREQDRIEEETVDGTNDQDAQQQPEELSHDELDGRSVEHAHGKDGGQGAMDHRRKGVLKG